MIGKHTFHAILLVAITELLGTKPGLASPDIAAKQRDEKTATAPHQLPERWTLADAVAYALENSPRTKFTRDQIATREAEVTAANSYFFPSLGLASQYSQTNNPMYSFGNILNQGAFDDTINFNDPGRTDALLLEARIDYRLYDGGKRQAGVEQAQAAQIAALRFREEVERTLAFEVVQSFHRIIQAKEMVTVRKAEVDAIAASLQVGQARFEAGDLLKEDLLNLELQKERATENHIRSIHDLRLAKRQFWNLLGFETEHPETMPENIAMQQVPELLSPENRSELRVMDARIRQSEAMLRNVRGDRLPTIDSFGQYQFEYGTVLGESGDSWLAGVRLDYSLYNGRRTEAKIAAAKAQLASLKNDRERLKLALNLDLQRAEIQYQQTLERLQVTNKMVQVAAKSTELSRARFQEGLILVSDLIDFEMRLTDAKARRSSARADNRIAIANLRRAVGAEQFPATNSQ